MNDGSERSASKLCKMNLPDDEALSLDPKLWKELPQELLEKAIGKVPFASLVNFRAVSKHWCSVVIPCAAFEARTSGKTALLYFGCYDEGPVGGPAWWLQLCNTSDFTGPVDEFHPNSFPYPSVNEDVRLLASEGGLLFFAFVTRKCTIVRNIVVCNPLISQCRSLCLPVALRPCRPCNSVLIGVVLDASTDSYQLVVRGVDETWQHRIFLYHSRTCTWTESESTLLEDGEDLQILLSHSVQRSVCCNGNLYFYARLNRTLCILKFDIKGDTWTRIPAPSLSCWQSLGMCQMAAYDGEVLVWLLHKPSVVCVHRLPLEFDHEITLMPKIMIDSIEVLQKKFITYGEICKDYSSFCHRNCFYHVTLVVDCNGEQENIREFQRPRGYSEDDFQRREDFMRIVVHNIKDNSFTELPTVKRRFFPTRHNINPLNVCSFAASLSALP